MADINQTDPGPGGHAWTHEPPVLDANGYDDTGHDTKGRPHPDLMNDRQVMVECMMQLRSVADAVDDMMELPMVKAMANGQNPLAAMIGAKR